MGFLDSLFGNTAADASNAAAGDTYNKQRQALATLRGAGDQYASGFNNLAANYQPYTQAGTSSLSQLMAGLGLGGDQQAFTDAYRGLPGYQNGLQAGSNAITGNAAARGMLNSGSTLKALQKFGSNYEDQRAGDHLSRLMGLSTQGLGATQASNATAGQGLTGKLQTDLAAYGGDMTSAGTIGQGQIAGANAQAQGAQNIFNTAANLFGKGLGFFAPG